MIHYKSKVNGEIILHRNTVRYFINSGCFFTAVNSIIIDDVNIFTLGVKVILTNHDIDNFDKHTKDRTN